MPLDSEGRWGYEIPVPPGLSLADHSAIATLALRGLLEGLRLKELEPTGKPRLRFVRALPELLHPGERLTHRWRASVPYRRS